LDFFAWGEEGWGESQKKDRLAVEKKKNGAQELIRRIVELLIFYQEGGAKAKKVEENGDVGINQNFPKKA